jgi:hypothetical protein
MLEPILSSGSVTVLQNNERFILPDNVKLVWEVCTTVFVFCSYLLNRSHVVDLMKFFCFSTGSYFLTVTAWIVVLYLAFKQHYFGTILCCDTNRLQENYCQIYKYS